MDGGINTNISGAGTEGPGVVSGGEAPETVGTPAAALSAYQQSTISESEELMAAEMLALMMVAGIPLLTPPKDVSSSGNVNGVEGTASYGLQYLMLSTQEQKNEIIRSMLDKWLDNIRTIAEDSRNEDLRRRTEDVDKPGPKSSTEYFAYLLTVSANVREKELNGDNPLAVQFTNTYNQWMVNPSLTAADTGQYPDSSFIAGCLTCSPEAFRTAIGADSAMLGIQLSVSPVADALAGGAAASGLPMDSQAAAAMIAAMLYNGALYRANVETLSGAVQKGQAPQNLEFAMNYAKQVTAIVTAHVEGSEPPTEEAAARNTLIRLMLSSMALNLLYRQAYGGMSGKDMEQLLNGGDISDIPDPAVRAQIGQLVSLIQGYLPKDPRARSEAIAQLSEHVDDKESADSMLETTNLFAGMLNVKGINASRLGSATA